MLDNIDAHQCQANGLLPITWFVLKKYAKLIIVDEPHNLRNFQCLNTSWGTPHNIAFYFSCHSKWKSWIHQFIRNDRREEGIERERGRMDV